VTSGNKYTSFSCASLSYSYSGITVILSVPSRLPFRDFRHLAIILLFQFHGWACLLTGDPAAQTASIMMIMAITAENFHFTAGILEQGISRFNLLGMLLGPSGCNAHALYSIQQRSRSHAVHPACRGGWMITGKLLK